MINLKSTAVKVFPSAFRGLADGTTTQYNPEARLTTEFNVTNLTNRLSSKDSFVISWTGSVATFNIHGYYFEANLTDLLAGEGADWDNVYAYIRVLPFQPIDVGNTTYQAFTLVGADDDGTTVLPRILDETSVESSVDTFLGLGLQETQKTDPLDPGVYGLHLLQKDGETWLVSSIPTASKLKFKSTEIEDLTAGKSIYEELNTGKITLSGKINNIKVTAPTTEATLTIAEGKTLEVNDTITVGTNAITLASNKSLTMQYAGLTVGASNGTGTVNIKTSGATERSLTLTGSPSLSGITTTGTGTLALNKNLTVNGADKIFAGDGNSLTIDNNLDIAGTTAQITLGTGAHTLAFETTANTAITLPTTGTLATIAGSEDLTSKTINGLTLTSKTSGFEISGGTTNSKKLTVEDTYTLRDACAMGVKDTGTATVISYNGTNLMTEKAVYYGLPTINNSHSYDSDTDIFAPITSGTEGQLLMSEGSSNAPTWTTPSEITVGTATNAISAINAEIAQNAVKTSFTNNSFNGPISISSSGSTPAPLLLVGKTYQIYISFEGNPYDNKWSLGLIRIPGGLDETVYTVSGALGHYLEFYHPSQGEYSFVTCWVRPDTTASKTACNLHYKVIN